MNVRPFKCQINNLEQNGNAGRERITPVHRPASLLDVDEMRRYITLSTDRCEFLIHASFVMINDRNAIKKKSQRLLYRRCSRCVIGAAAGPELWRVTGVHRLVMEQKVHSRIKLTCTALTDCFLKAQLQLKGVPRWAPPIFQSTGFQGGWGSLWLHDR